MKTKKTQVNEVFFNGVISAIKNLHYIMIGTKDVELQESCKRTIALLHERELLPYTEFYCSFAKNSN